MKLRGDAHTTGAHDEAIRFQVVIGLRPEPTRDPAILCAKSLRQNSAVITTLFDSAESLIEVNLFAELVSRIEKAFERLGN